MFCFLRLQAFKTSELINIFSSWKKVPKIAPSSTLTGPDWNRLKMFDFVPPIHWFWLFMFVRNARSWTTYNPAESNFNVILLLAALNRHHPATSSPISLIGRKYSAEGGASRMPIPPAAQVADRWLPRRIKLTSAKTRGLSMKIDTRGPLN